MSDVVKEIEKTGKYTPPKVFYRYHGYLMLEIREKPLTLQNYRFTEYISLFDLYFTYYSPIFFKRDTYLNYVTGLDLEIGRAHV